MFDTWKNKKESLRRSLPAIVPLLILSSRMYVLLYIYIYIHLIWSKYSFFSDGTITLCTISPLNPAGISNAINKIRRFCPSPRIWPELPETSQICRGCWSHLPLRVLMFFWCFFENKWVTTELLNQKSNAVFRMFLLNNSISINWFETHDFLFYLCSYQTIDSHHNVSIQCTFPRNSGMRELERMFSCETLAYNMVQHGTSWWILAKYSKFFVFLQICDPGSLHRFLL